MIILTINSFIHFYKIATKNTTEGLLQAYIDSNEELGIKQLLGVELGDLFIADLIAGVPQDARFVAIFNPFIDDDALGQSKGMKAMLTSFVYYQYIKNSQSVSTQSGVSTLGTEAGKIVTFENAVRSAEVRFNDGLETFYSIRKYIQENQSTYPEFKGVIISPVYSPIL